MRWFKDCLVDVLKRVADYAAGLGVPIAFEYTNRFEINTINTAAEAREIVERVGSPNLGVLVDTYHSFLEDPDVCQNIRDLNGRVRYFHADSNRGRPRFRGENDLIALSTRAVRFNIETGSPTAC
jgi:D-psicose/D-tagatose/L-ribulose 3-epimerase